MFKLLQVSTLLFLCACGYMKESKTITAAKANRVANVHAHTLKDIDGVDVPLSSFTGKALLIVNTASKCGYTPQYSGLEKLYQDYKARGFLVLGFPSNDFGGQEPGTEAQIATFCKKNHGVTFPLFSKVHAKGEEQSPLYKTMVEESGEGIRGPVTWNFTKFLVDKKGNVVGRFGPRITPDSPDLIAAVESVLAP